MTTDELQAVEQEIAQVTEHLAKLKRRAAELQDQSRQAGFEEVKSRLARLQASLDSYAASGGMKSSTPHVIRYYVLDGKKYPLQRGRLYKVLEDYRNKGGDLSRLVQTEPVPEQAS